MKADPRLEHLDLIDLLSERHTLLRSIAAKKWNETSEIRISNSEWYIMARVYKKKVTISYVTKHVDISRQATHKFIKRLSEKGLVSIYELKDNRKEKGIELTELGLECYEKNEALKAELERKVEGTIGKEALETLKTNLKMDWKLDG